MDIEVFTLGPLFNNTILLTCEKTKISAVVDPSFGIKKVLSYIDKKELSLEKVLLTHSHYDHTEGISLIKEKKDVLIYIHKLDKKTLETPEKIPFIGKPASFKADVLLEDGDIIDVGQIKIKVIHTPGHTPGSSCFYIEKEKILISGDTLFKNSMGRVDFPSSNPSDMWESLKKLSKLPKDTIVIPGHGSQTTIEKESWMGNAEKYFS
jgi:glyoxylase-like metal-dependent hydrolase (beta-lactamase superfamily II)